jgi:hypothetical protein
MADSTQIWAATRPGDCGVFYRAPLGTALPTLATAPWATLPTAFMDHGWMGDDGMANGMKRDVTDHQAFGGDIVKTTQNKYTETLKVTCFETNPNVLKSVFGDANVIVAGTSHRQITVNHSSLPLLRSVFVWRCIEGSKTRLIMAQTGQIITVDDVVFVNKDLVKYTTTIQCYKPSPTVDAVTELIDEPDVALGS